MKTQKVNKIKEEVKEVKKIVTSRGSDPEFFIRNTETGDIESAVEVLKRDKYNPIDLGDGVSLYFDNCMGEMTVKPAFSRAEFVESFRDAFTKVNKYIKDNCGEKYEIVIQASHTFDEKYMQSPEAMTIGCNPEYKIYPEPAMITPPSFKGFTRSSGGHVSLGREDYLDIQDTEEVLMGFQSKIDLMKLLDYYLAVPFTLIDNDKTSLARRALYGGEIGAHRPKDFGGEYRVLSCYWTSSPKLVELVYDLSEEAIKRLISGDYLEILEIDYKLAQACVQENNKELAEEILDMVKLPKNLRIRLNQYKNVKSWNFYKEWNLNKSTKNLTVNA
jgi:hypothetical protein